MRRIDLTKGYTYVFRLLVVILTLALLATFISLLGYSSFNLGDSVPRIENEEAYELQLRNIYTPGRVIGGISYYSFGGSESRSTYMTNVVGINRIIDMFRLYEVESDLDQELLLKRLEYSEDFYKAYLENTLIKSEDLGYNVGNILISYYDIAGLVQERKLLDSIEYELDKYGSIYEFDEDLIDKVNEVKDINKTDLYTFGFKVLGLTLLTIALRFYFYKVIKSNVPLFFRDGSYLVYNGLHIGMLLGVSLYILYSILQVYI